MATTIKTIQSTARIDGSVPADFKAATGKQNLITSINKWLIDTVRGGHVGDTPLPVGKDFYWAFDRPVAPLNMPAVSTTEIGLFDVGARAFDGNLVGFDSNGKPLHAVQNQTLMEITCWALDSDNFGQATKKVRELRDRIVFAIEFAGVMNDREDAFIIGPIMLKDFSQEDTPVVGVVRLDPTGNAINEKFLIDPVNNQLKMYKLLVRFLYDEYSNPL